MTETPTFGDWVRGMRKRLGWSQQRLATELGMDRAHVSKIESGVIALPEADTRARFHGLFDTSDADLESLGIVPRYDTWGRVVPIEQAAPPTPAASTVNPFPPADPRHRLVELLKGIDLDGHEAAFWRGYIALQIRMLRDAERTDLDEIDAFTDLGTSAYVAGLDEQTRRRG